MGLERPDTDYKLREQVVEALAETLRQSGVLPNEMNPVAWRILSNATESAFHYYGNDGNPGEDKGLPYQEFCWCLREISQMWTFLSYESLLESLTKKTLYESLLGEWLECGTDKQRADDKAKKRYARAAQLMSEFKQTTSGRYYSRDIGIHFNRLKKTKDTSLISGYLKEIYNNINKNATDYASINDEYLEARKQRLFANAARGELAAEVARVYNRQHNHQYYQDLAAERRAIMNLSLSTNSDAKWVTIATSRKTTENEDRGTT